MVQSTQNTFSLQAPLSGWVVPLEEVPDPVFAQKLMGEGISIDPTDECLCAPCDATISQIHQAQHALTLTTRQGINIIIHIGLDTVALNGQGFRALVKAGQEVSAGTPLIEFDADFLCTQVKSLLTQIIIANPEDNTWTLVSQASDLVQVSADTLLTFQADTPIATQHTKTTVTTTTPQIEQQLTLYNSQGLHARPAAKLAQMAATFKADLTIVNANKQQANAKSVVGLLTLGIEAGQTLTLQASGEQCDLALRELSKYIEQGLGEENTQPTTASIGAAQTSYTIAGVTVSPGMAFGQTLRIEPHRFEIKEIAQDITTEHERFKQAHDKVKHNLETQIKHLTTADQTNQASIFAAHQSLLDDPDLLTKTNTLIAHGKSAAYAWQHTIDQYIQKIKNLSNPHLSARADDIQDIGQTVLNELCEYVDEFSDLKADSILIATTLLPSQIARLEGKSFRGICMYEGSKTSHVAILARTWGIPMLSGISPDHIPSEISAIIDGPRQRLQLNPSAAELAKIKGYIQDDAKQQDLYLASAHQPALTQDGSRIDVLANVGSIKESQQVNGLGGEGIGLLRTEFLFIDRAGPPSEEEQFKAYQQMANSLAKQPIIIRTLDIGGDKPLSYCPQAQENNPFLGERGIRVSLARPEMLRTQLRAILRCSAHHPVKVMFPMITTLEDWRSAKQILTEEQQRLNIPKIETGIMVETPACALHIHKFAEEADFFSIGSNDLTQYTLAMDRSDPKWATQADPLHPAVLNLISQITTCVNAQHKSVSVCGDMTYEPLAVSLLLGLGVQKISVSLPAIPAIKAHIRACHLSQCRELATKALQQATATEVRQLVNTLKTSTDHTQTEEQHLTEAT